MFLTLRPMNTLPFRSIFLHLLPTHFAIFRLDDRYITVIQFYFNFLPSVGFCLFFAHLFPQSTHISSSEHLWTPTPNGREHFDCATVTISSLGSGVTFRHEHCGLAGGKLWTSATTITVYTYGPCIQACLLY